MHAFIGDLLKYVYESYCELNTCKSNAIKSGQNGHVKMN